MVQNKVDQMHCQYINAFLIDNHFFVLWCVVIVQVTKTLEISTLSIAFYIHGYNHQKGVNVLFCFVVIILENGFSNSLFS